jgi:hypothetical protein
LERIDSPEDLPTLEPAWVDLFAFGAQTHLANSWPYIVASVCSPWLRNREWRIYSVWEGASLRAGMFGTRGRLRVGRTEVPILEAGTEFAGDVLADVRDGGKALSTLLTEAMNREGVPILHFGRVTERGLHVLRAAVEQAGLRCTWRPEGYGYAWDATIERDRMYEKLGRRRRNSLRRSGRRFGEAFTLELQVSSSAHSRENQRNFDAFLELEAAGWKGREGTAIRKRVGNEEYFRVIVEEASRLGMVRWISLLADGRIAAMNLAIQTGRTIWVPKTTYDEAFARHSPGSELAHRFHLACVEDPSIDTVNWIGAPHWLDSWRPRRVVFTNLRVFGDSSTGRGLYWASRLQRILRRHVTARGEEEADRNRRYL